MSSLHAMPFLIMNYGAEMVFILEQRLQAQQVNKEKSSKVLQDLLHAMFAPSFLTELMRPQPLYSTAATREVFDRLAHSTIMRLSDNSMEKLYDLMTMGVKYALMSARHPTDLIEVTMNHLDNIKISVGSELEVLNNACEAFTTLASSLSIGELADVRHTLLAFFQMKRVKVSLFLQENMQNSDGSFNISQSGPVAQDPIVKMPGTIQYYEGGKATSSDSFTHRHLSDYKPNPKGNTERVNPFVASQRTTPLGRNIYLTERKKPGSAGSSSQAASSETESAGQGDKPMKTTRIVVKDLPTKHSASFRTNPKALTTTTAALNSLATLIAPPKATAGTFRVSNLFGEEDAGASASSAGEPLQLPSQPVIKISALSKEEALLTNAELARVIDGFKDTDAAQGGEDDLLDLMDKA